MALRLNFDPSKPKQTQIVSLDGRQYKIRAAWKERLRGWYLDVRLVDDTAVALGVRVNANGLLVRDMNRWNDALEAGGVLAAIGANDQIRESLGQPGGLNVLYLTRAEWDAAVASVGGGFDLLVTTP